MESRAGRHVRGSAAVRQGFAAGLGAGKNWVVNAPRGSASRAFNWPHSTSCSARVCQRSAVIWPKRFQAASDSAAAGLASPVAQAKRQRTNRAGAEFERGKVHPRVQRMDAAVRRLGRDMVLQIATPARDAGRHHFSHQFGPRSDRSLVGNQHARIGIEPEVGEHQVFGIAALALGHERLAKDIGLLGIIRVAEEHHHVAGVGNDPHVRERDFRRR